MSDDSNVVDFPMGKKIEDCIIGPFEEHYVVLEGFQIPKLQANIVGDDVHFMLDHRFGISVPKSRAVDIAWFVANAMAVAAGYAWFGAEEPVKGFARKTGELVRESPGESR